MASSKANRILHKTCIHYPEMIDPIKSDTLRFILGWVEDKIAKGETKNLYNYMSSKVKRFSKNEEFTETFIYWVRIEYDI